MYLSVICLILFTFCALFANILANKNPIYCQYQGEHHFPAFQDKVFIFGAWQKTNRVRWDTLTATKTLWPLVQYNSDQNLKHRRLGPLEIPTQKRAGEEIIIGKRHWLGTNAAGRDILASIIYGARRSLGISLFTILIIVLIGVPLGGIAAYFQDDRLHISRAKAWLFLPGIMLGWFYAFHVRSLQLIESGQNPFTFLVEMIISLGIFGSVLFICLSLSRLFSKIPFLHAQVPVKLDMFISRFMEIIQALPSLLLIITLSAFLGNKNIWFVMFLLASVSWIGVARVVRAEVLSVRERTYILAAKASGIPNPRIITQHILPNALSSIWPMLAFGIGNIILIDSALSFLSLIDGSEASWGGLVTDGKDNWKLWWISLFPGICIFLSVYSFNILGERLRDILDPHSQ